jgi:DNA invertase Pin-like site-specific DNA recombinase
MTNVVYGKRRTNVTKRDATRGTGRRQTRARGRRIYGGYPRVSDVGRREADERLRSPEFQEELIDRAAGEHGVDVRMYPAELDVSGAKRERVILDSIVAAIEDGELDGIIVAKLDRLSRLAPKDRIELVERIEAAGGEILSASEAFDTKTPEGRFVRELFFSLARMEWERIAGGWDQAKRYAIAAGRAIAKTPAFGYRFDRDHRYVKHPTEAAIVVELFELRAGGASWTTLLERFEARTGRSTARQTMSELVRSRVYLGEVAYGTELVNVDAHEAIVELDLFETVQRVNAERAGDGAGQRHSGAPVSMLGGFATCEGCRRPMSSHARRERSRRYECSTPGCPRRATILADDLDAHVWESVLAWAGPAADELVELELELDASGGRRIVAEHRLAEAERVALEYELDVELELELGRETFAAGRRARLDVVELRRQELEAIGEASELELARTTLRQAVESHALEVEESRRLLKVVLVDVVVRRAPRRPVDERAELRYAAPLVGAAIAEPAEDDRAERVEELSS